jgi:ubiquinone biosynthesis accessory factor UbiK
MVPEIIYFLYLLVAYCRLITGEINRMLKQNTNADFVQEIFKLLPDDLRKHKDGLKKNVSAAINASLIKMELVTREEFDIQRELLSKTRALVEELEEKVTQLESQLSQKD